MNETITFSNSTEKAFLKITMNLTSEILSVIINPKTLFNLFFGPHSMAEPDRAKVSDVCASKEPQTLNEKQHKHRV